MTAVRRLWFEAPYRIAIRDEPLADPGPGQILVRTCVSAISPGTEMLFYRGEIPEGISADATIAALASSAAYPLRYGYAAVGHVEAAGPDSVWKGRRVFAFEPHADALVTSADAIIPIPDQIPDDAAALYPNAETAVTLVLDGAPLAGERVMVIGAGIVGLLTLKLLSAFPLAELVAVDPAAQRREWALHSGASLAVTLAEAQSMRDFDLVFEVSGNPAALNQAIASAGFAARVVIGSWYGSKPVTLDLGGHFHRSRMRLISSQVSTLPPNLTGRWNRERRTQQAWRLLADPGIPALVTHRFAFENAAEAYALIDRPPPNLLQILIDYP